MARSKEGYRKAFEDGRKRNFSTPGDDRLLAEIRSMARSPQEADRAINGLMQLAQHRNKLDAVPAEPGLEGETRVNVGDPRTQNFMGESSRQTSGVRSTEPTVREEERIMTGGDLNTIPVRTPYNTPAIITPVDDKGKPTGTSNIMQDLNVESQPRAGVKNIAEEQEYQKILAKKQQELAFEQRLQKELTEEEYQLYKENAMRTLSFKQRTLDNRQNALQAKKGPSWLDQLANALSEKKDNPNA